MSLNDMRDFMGKRTRQLGFTAHAKQQARGDVYLATGCRTRVWQARIEHRKSPRQVRPL